MSKHSAPLEALIAPTRRVRTLARRVTSKGRVLPGVVLAGVQKGGTTSLYHQLRAHPNVVWLGSKGAHYFDLHWERGPDWYRSLFPHRLRVALRAARSTGPVITAESTGYYFDHPLAPQRCAETLPDARVVIMLRNPIERAYSAYHDAVGKGYEPLSFEEALDREAERLEGEESRLATDPTATSVPFRHLGYVTRGIYADPVARWLARFPGDQVLVVQSERFYRDMAAEYSRILSALGLPQWAPARFEKRNSGSYEPIKPETRERLASAFRPHNQRLYELLDVDYGWS